MDMDLVREMSLHVVCDPSTATNASEIFTSKFKGRIFSQEDSAVLQFLSGATSLPSGEIRIYDVSRFTDKLRALAKGASKTPVIIIDGKRHEGMEECLAALDKLLGY